MRRIKPAAAALGKERDDAVIGGAARSRERVDLRRREDIRVRPERLGMFVDIRTDRVDPRLCLDRRRLRVGGGDRTPEGLGERVVDFAGEVIERALLVETAHLDRPFDGGPGAADREPAVGFASDRLDAAVDFRRVRGVDGKLCFARLLRLPSVE